MVGQTTQVQMPRNIHELTDEIKGKWLDTKQKIVDLKKMITEIERDLAAAEAEERLLDSILFSMKHMGEPAAGSRKRPKRDIRKSNEEEENDEELEEEREEEDRGD